MRSSIAIGLPILAFAAVTSAVTQYKTTNGGSVEVHLSSFDDGRTMDWSRPKAANPTTYRLVDNDSPQESVTLRLFPNNTIVIDRDGGGSFTGKNTLYGGLSLNIAASAKGRIDCDLIFNGDSNVRGCRDPGDLGAVPLADVNIKSTSATIGNAFAITNDNLMRPMWAAMLFLQDQPRGPPKPQPLGPSLLG